MHELDKQVQPSFNKKSQETLVRCRETSFACPSYSSLCFLRYCHSLPGAFPI